MYYSMRSLLFDPVGWLGARRGKRGLSVRTEKRTLRREEERLYQERLLQVERAYVRQAMEAYARRKA